MSISVRFAEEPKRPRGGGRWAVLAGPAVALALGVVGAGAAAVLSASGAMAGRVSTARVGATGVPPVPSRPLEAFSGPRPGSGTGSGIPGRDGGPGAARRSPGGPRTSCRAVAHIGDSTSVGLVSPVFLSSRAQRLAARYHRVGAGRVRADASGGRSVLEALPGQVNGFGAASAMARRGFHGCWVIALGTNDTVNVAAGAPAGRMARIKRMISVAHGQPVLWVNVKTLTASGPYADHYMRAWNAALRRACARFPNLRVFDWAAVAKGRWFAPDGIHYTPAGYAARARLIAAALARAFPRVGASQGCVVR